MDIKLISQIIKIKLF
ncbi:UNVERIFIED_CONTAM: hypothetical protein GTU68_013080 [Idotea baltica]|nr:hypothetical protein [Idotea baltica]